MNKYFSKVTSLLLAGVMVLAAGCTDYKEDINNLRDDFQESLDQKALALTEQIDALKAANASLEKALSDAKAEADKLYATKVELEGVSADLSTAIKDGDDKLQGNINNLTDKVNGIDGRVGDLESFKAEAIVTLNGMQEKIGKNTSDIAGLKTELANLKSTFEGKVGEFEQRIAANEAAIKTMTEETIPEIQDRLDKTDLLITSLQTATTTTAQDLEDFKKQTGLNIKALQDAIDNLKAAAATKEELESLENAINETLKGYVTTAALTEKLENLKADLEAQIDAVEKAYKEADAAFAKQLTDLQAELEAADAANKALIEEKIAAVEAAYEEADKKLEARISALETALADAEKAIKANDAAIKALDKKVDDAVKTLNADIDNLETLINNGAEVDEKLQKQINEANANIVDLGKQIVDLQNKLNDINFKLGLANANINKILARVQSIVYVPDYTDGFITVNNAVLAGEIVEGVTSIRYKVLPETAAADLADAYAKDNAVLSYVVTDELKNRIETKAGAAPEFKVVAAKADEKGYLTLTVATRNLPEKFYNQESIYAISLVAADPKTKNNVSTVFTNVVAGEAVVILPKIVNQGGADVTNLQDAWTKELEYTDLNPVVLLEGHELRYVIGADKTYYTAAKMAEMGYVLPKVTNKSEGKFELEGCMLTDVKDEESVRKTLELKQLGEDGELYRYVQANLAQANPKAVGLVYRYTYTYVIGDTVVNAGAILKIIPNTPEVIFEDVEVMWDYALDAKADADKKEFIVREKDNLVEIKVKSHDLPEDLTPQEVFATKPVTTVYLDNKPFKDNEISALFNCDKDGKYTVKLWFRQDVGVDRIWGKTFQIVGEFDRTSGEEGDTKVTSKVKATLNVKMVDRPGDFTVQLTPDAEVDLTKNFVADHGKLGEASSIEEMFTKMAGHTGKLTAAEYIKDVLVDHEYAQAGTIGNGKQEIVSDKAWTSSLRLNADKGTKNATIGYSYKTEGLVELGTSLVYKAVVTTWFGQKITFVKNLNLAVPAYKFAHFDYRVMFDEAAKIYYTKADGLYADTDDPYDPANKGKKSDAVKTFSIAEVDLPSAFNIVDAEGKDVDAVKLGLTPEFFFATDPADKGITLKDNILSYDGMDDNVKINAKLYIANDNDTQFEVEGAFDAYKNRYYVEKFNPIGLLQTTVNNAYVEVLNPVEYEVNILDYYTLMENRQVYGDETGKYNHPLIVDGGWVIGDGTNGFAVGTDVTELYDLEIDYEYVNVPDAYVDVIEVKENGVLTFDNKAMMKLNKDLVIPVKLVISSKWDVQGDNDQTENAWINIVFKKNI